MQILLKTLRKAPFSYANEIVLKSIPNNTINSILDHIMQDYPLVNFLGDWMTSFMGSEEVKEQLSDSTPTVQSNSDGQKKKQTNTVPSSSKK